MALIVAYANVIIACRISTAAVRSFGRILLNYTCNDMETTNEIAVQDRICATYRPELRPRVTTGKCEGPTTRRSNSPDGFSKRIGRTFRIISVGRTKKNCISRTVHGSNIRVLIG